ncbi:IS1-like element transposase [Klebsiella pneumoniae]
MVLDAGQPPVLCVGLNTILRHLKNSGRSR